MESFLREPSRLAAEQRRIETDMVQTSLKHYPVFIQSATGCRDALQEVEKDREIVERLRAEEQALRRRLNELMERGEDWKRGRQRLLVLRSSQEKLRELFEIPSLLESCLRNELYHEAILLHEKVESLLASGSDLPALCLVGDEVEETMRKHLPQVIAKLATPLSPAQCLKVVRFLSRLHIMGDREQRKLFLSRRLAYLQSLLLQERQRSAFAYLSRVSNVMGASLGGVINEYRSTFETREYNTLSPYDTEYDVPSCDVLGAWISGVIDDYLAILRKHLPLVSGGGELKALLDVTMQSGARLAKGGVDIRPILAELFEDRVLSLWKEGVEAACAAFTLALGNHQWSQKHSSHQAVLRAESGARPDAVSTAPPMVLHQFLPLAYLCNGMLNTLNELRRCALVAVAPRAAEALSAALRGLVGHIVRLSGEIMLDDQEMVSLAAFCKVMTDDLLPYLARCFTTAFALPDAIPIRDIAHQLVDIYRPHLQRTAPAEAEADGPAEGSPPRPGTNGTSRGLPESSPPPTPAPPPGPPPGPPPASGPTAGVDALRQFFDRADVNGDGSISRSELLRALRSDSAAHLLLVPGGGADAPPGYWVELLFQRLDTDRDGTISWGELEHHATQVLSRSGVPKKID